MIRFNSRDAGLGVRHAENTLASQAVDRGVLAGPASRHLVAGVISMGLVLSSGCGVYRHRDRKVEYDAALIHSEVSVSTTKKVENEQRDRDLRVVGVNASAAEVKLSVALVSECRAATYSTEIVERRQTRTNHTGLIAAATGASLATTAGSLAYLANHPLDEFGDADTPEQEAALLGVGFGGAFSVLGLLSFGAERELIASVGWTARVADRKLVAADKWVRCSTVPYSGDVLVFVTGQTGTQLTWQGVIQNGTISWTSESIPSEMLQSPTWDVSVRRRIFKKEHDLDKHDDSRESLSVQGDAAAALATRKAKEAADDAARDAARKAQEAADAEETRKFREKMKQRRDWWYELSKQTCKGLYVGRPVSVALYHDNVEGFSMVGGVAWSSDNPNGTVVGIGENEATVITREGRTERVRCGFLK